MLNEIDANDNNTAKLLPSVRRQSPPLVAAMKPSLIVQSWVKKFEAHNSASVSDEST